MGYIETSLKLISIKGLGCRKILKLASQFHDINEIFAQSPDALFQQKLIDRHQKDILERGYNQRFVDDTLDILSKSPFQIITIFDEHYPELLKKLYDPPIVLFVNGEFKPEDHDAVSVVGTRLPSTYGKNVTDKIVHDLVNNNFTVI